MLRWGPEKQVDLHFIDPGKPVQNAHIESFKREGSRRVLEPAQLPNPRPSPRGDWVIDYNEIRPRSSLGNRTPKEFAAHFAITHPSQLSAA